MKTSIIDIGLLIIGIVFGITFLVSYNIPAGALMLIFSANTVFNMIQKGIVRKREQMWHEFLEKHSISHIWEQFKEKYK